MERENPALLINCNDYTNHTNTWSVNPQNFGTLADQGTGANPIGEIRAGNTFNDPICLTHGTTNQHMISPQYVEFAYYSNGDGMGSFPDPTCIDLPERDGDILLKDIFYTNVGNDASCDESDPCPDPPNCNQAMQRIANDTIEVYQLMEANRLINYFIGLPDSLYGDSLAIEYINRSVSSNSFASQLLNNLSNRSSELNKAIVAHAPEENLYLEENNTQNLSHDPYKFLAFPHHIEQISFSIRIAKAENNNQSGNNILIIPNPNNGTFDIQLTGFTGSSQLKIIDSQGRMIISERLENTNRKTIDLRNNAQGIYHILLLDEAGASSSSRVSIVR